MQPHPRKITAIVTKLLGWYSQNARDLPWRRTKDPYLVYVSEIMLQQTQVTTVVPYYERWTHALPTLQALANARPEKLLRLWEGLGYYSRVRNLQRAACQIVENHAGRFPSSFEDILALPGVGRYTAGAVCSIAFNQAEPILDGNVARVLARLFALNGDPRSSKESTEFWNLCGALVRHARELESTGRLPKGVVRACSEFNQSLMELGALLCTPANPRCHDCPVVSSCRARQENRVDQFPRHRVRAEAVQRHQVCFIVRKAAKMLVRQRPAGAVNAGFWEIPTFDIPDKRAGFEAAANEIGTRVMGNKPLCTIRHTITRYRITVDVYEAVLLNGNILNGLTWSNAASLKLLPMTTASRKILKRLEASS